MTTAQVLQSLALPFRNQPLDEAQLAKQVHAWADAFPHLCRVSVLTRTPQERPVWLMTLGLRQNAGGPSVWLDGNMHASETCGSSVALAVAESVLRLHLADEADGVPPHLRQLLRQLTFFVVPRLCPDGA